MLQEAAAGRDHPVLHRQFDAIVFPRLLLDGKVFKGVSKIGSGEEFPFHAIACRPLYCNAPANG